MAMDKEILMQRLQTQYLTRQEVLFKLPLNISINSFWPELIERRKLSSVVLPLHRADGKPLGNVKWTSSGVAATMRNERYCGDVYTRKTFKTVSVKARMNLQHALFNLQVTIDELLQAIKE